jgi:hypothetical protein
MTQIQFGLEFPEGHFLISQNRPYFWVEGEDTAYALPYNDFKELDGKHLYTVNGDRGANNGYAISHEVEDGALISARLKTKFGRSAGKLMDAAKIAELNERLEQGSFEFYCKPNQSRICHAGQLMDGRYMLLLDDYSNNNLDRTLFVGERGNLQPVETTNGLQGGNSFYFTDAKTGERIEFEAKGFSSGRNIQVAYGDVRGVGLDVDDAYDLAAWGIHLPEAKPYYDIYSHPKSKLAMKLK